MGNEVADEMVSMLRNDEWRRTRYTMSPLFSTGKLKMVRPIALSKANLFGAQTDFLPTKPAGSRDYAHYQTTFVLFR